MSPQERDIGPLFFGKGGRRPGGLYGHRFFPLMPETERLNGIALFFQPAGQCRPGVLPFKNWAEGRNFLQEIRKTPVEHDRRHKWRRENSKTAAPLA